MLRYVVPWSVLIKEEMEEVPVTRFFVLWLGQVPKLMTSLFVPEGMRFVVTIVIVRLLLGCSVQAEKDQPLEINDPCWNWMKEVELREKVPSRVVDPEKLDVEMAELGFWTLLTATVTVSNRRDAFVMMRMLPATEAGRGVPPTLAVVEGERVMDAGKVRLRLGRGVLLSKVICHW